MGSRAPHQPIIENYGDLGMTWIASCWCGTWRGTYRTEGTAKAAHAEHVIRSRGGRT